MGAIKFSAQWRERQRRTDTDELRQSCGGPRAAGEFSPPNRPPPRL